MRLSFSVSTSAFAILVALLAGCSNSHGVQALPVGSAGAENHLLRPSSAEKVLYSFAGGTDGQAPQARLINVNGTFYGTTTNGGSPCNCGTVFKMTKKGKESVLYSFTGGTDGRDPSDGLVNVNGTLYGTTFAGGSYACDCGTVFKITTSGVESVLYSFAGGSDGANPFDGLTNVNGTLYGTTEVGGGTGCSGEGCGTVFAVTSAGKERIVYSFAGGSDGQWPQSGLTQVNGTFYGTTTAGGGSGCGGSGCGTVFVVGKKGNESVLHAFAGSDGQFPAAALTNVSGTLYGTTLEGGGGCACGTVFSITTSGVENVVYNFLGGTDGAAPHAGLVDVNGTLYGTTYNGGDSACIGGCGTVFAIAPPGGETVLYRFMGGSDGEWPLAGLENVSGILYGTTVQGGSGECSDFEGSGCGTVFKIVP